jgi:acyl-CoA synthetase (AMP-forming)/AMP-acid ligase II
VFGVPDPRTGEAIVAAVVPASTRRDADPDAAALTDELRELVASSLASYKRLATVIVVAQIPRLPSGKVLRRELKADHTSRASLR